MKDEINITMDDIIVKVAKLLRDASDKRKPCNPVRNLLGANNLENAYAVQRINTAKYLEQGHKVVGCKIGATSTAVQTQFGINEPDFGVLYDTGRIVNGGKISFDEIMQPKIEGEIAFVLKKNITIEPLNVSDIIPNISHAVVAIELLGSRIKNWDIGLVDTVADNGSASHWVLGDKCSKIETIDLINCKMVMRKNGEIVSEGYGSDSLGSPLNSFLWLAKTLIRLGQPMHEGDVVLTGALGPVINATHGDHFSVSITKLGEASIEII